MSDGLYWNGKRFVPRGEFSRSATIRARTPVTHAKPSRPPPPAQPPQEPENVQEADDQQ